MKIAWIKAIFVLPFNAVVTIPLLILYFCDCLSLSKNPAHICLGFAVFLLGLFIAVWTMLLFANIGNGTLAPWNPTKNLVVIGPYAYVRNPMLSGVLTMILGESLIFSSLSVFGWALIFFLINTLYFIFSEEPGLEKRFGCEYLEYKKNVPRWIPRLSAWKHKNTF